MSQAARQQGSVKVDIPALLYDATRFPAAGTPGASIGAFQCEVLAHEVD
jgi:hypothetical protein